MNNSGNQSDSLVPACSTGAKLRPRGYRFGAMATAGLFLLLLSFTSLRSAAAETNHLPAVQTANRYLLIVETSSAMAKRANGVVAALERLMKSGMQDQLRSGDTIGLWTYNDELHAGDISIQQWTPKTGHAVTERLLKHLTSLPLEHKAKFPVVTPMLQRIIGSSRFITVILFTVGTDKLVGTPFDDEINKRLKDWRSDPAAKNQPLVVVLRCNLGVVTHYSVTPASWPVEFPPPSPEFEALAKQSNSPTNSQKTAATSRPAVGSPLIVTGKKKPAPTPSAAASPATAPIATPGPTTPPKPAPLPPQSFSEPTPASPADSVPAVPHTSAETATQTTAPSTTPAEPKSVTAPTQPALSTPQIAEAKPPVRTTVAQPSTATPPAPAPLPTASPTAAAAKPNPERVDATTGSMVDPGSSSSNSAAASEPGSVPPTVAAAPVKPGGIKPVLILAVCLGVAAICGLAVLLVARRARHNQPVSLITASLDRPKTP